MNRFQKLVQLLKWLVWCVLWLPRATRRAWLRARVPDRAQEIIANPAEERRLAVLNVVPRRCGLCRHFSRSDFDGALRKEKAFAEATTLLEPWQMAMPSRNANPSPLSNVSGDALNLRPDLREQWSDYGVCRKNNVAIWGFTEQPPMPEADSEPCKEWI